MKAKYINPYTDFGFKKIFGEEASKPQLIDFLNALLPEKNKITDLTFKNPENLGLIDSDRKAIFDIYCENEKGEKFIVELQKAKQNYFKERTIFYSTFPIREQAEKGEWNFNLKAIYCIGILDFTFNDYANEEDSKQVIHTITLKDQNNVLFYDKLTFMYLEMPNFNKVEIELKSQIDKWLFFIKNLSDLQTIPNIFKESIFEQALEKAEIAKFSPIELDYYETSLKSYRDLKGVIDTAFDDGKIEKSAEVVRKGKRMGISIKDLSELTGLSEDEIDRIS